MQQSRSCGREGGPGAVGFLFPLRVRVAGESSAGLSRCGRERVRTLTPPARRAIPHEKGRAFQANGLLRPEIAETLTRLHFADLAVVRDLQTVGRVLAGRPLNDVPRLLLELNRIAHPKVRARPARADPMHPAESVVSPDTAILHRLQQVAGCRTSSGQAETRFMQAGQECIAGRTHEAERVQIHVHGSTCPASRMPCARTAQTSCTHGPMSWPADEG